MKSSVYRADKISTFLSPNKIIIGAQAANQVGKEAKSLGARKALIVTTRGRVKAGVVGRMQKSLADEEIVSSIFDGVEVDTPARVVDECAQLAHEEKSSIIIGVGGGSSMDTAKAVSIMVTNEGKVLDYAGVDLVSRKGVPKILLPTTAGSGSEVSRVVVITDEADNTKKVVYSDLLLANVAIVDPLLGMSMSATVTADTGIDALIHAIESYVSVTRTPFSDLLAIEAIRLIAENLPATYAKGNNIEARFNMMFAATLGGLAFTSGGLGAVHGLAYVLGTEYHLSHGRSNAVMLPYVIEHNLIGNMSRYARIAQLMGENIDGLSPLDAATRCVDAVNTLLSILGISTKLEDYGISRDDLPKLVKGGMKQARLFGSNPRDLTEEDVGNIYSKAFRV